MARRTTRAPGGSRITVPDATRLQSRDLTVTARSSRALFRPAHAFTLASDDLGRVALSRPLGALTLSRKPLPPVVHFEIHGDQANAAISTRFALGDLDLQPSVGALAAWLRCAFGSSLVIRIARRSITSASAYQPDAQPEPQPHDSVSIDSALAQSSEKRLRERARLLLLFEVPIRSLRFRSSDLGRPSAHGARREMPVANRHVLLESKNPTSFGVPRDSSVNCLVGTAVLACAGAAQSFLLCAGARQ